MLTSGFNDYFGYVEIDDECDLDKILVIENQFRALSKLLFKGKKNEEISIRFRKLGRHKAAGLYFPSIGCLAVDIRNTDSLSHEYFHMLDSQHNNISSGYRFSSIVIKYKECVLDFLNRDENSATRKLLEGNGKYNLDYYFTPTEIFARCGEIYLTDILKVNNSLVKPDSKLSFAYPKEEKFLELVKDFYDEFLKKL